MERREIPNHERLDALFRGDAFAASLEARLVDWRGGWAQVRWTPRETQHNFAGGVHGGAIFSAADVALSVASNSWGRAAVAISLGVQFLAAPATDEALTVTCREVSRTRRTGAYGIEVVAGDATLVASLQATTYRSSDWHLGEDSWPSEWRAAV